MLIPRSVPKASKTSRDGFSEVARAPAIADALSLSSKSLSANSLSALSLFALLEHRIVLSSDARALLGHPSFAFPHLARAAVRACSRAAFIASAVDSITESAKWSMPCSCSQRARIIPRTRAPSLASSGSRIASTAHFAGYSLNHKASAFLLVGVFMDSFSPVGHRRGVDVGVREVETAGVGLPLAENAARRTHAPYMPARQAEKARGSLAFASRAEVSRAIVAHGIPPRPAVCAAGRFKDGGHG